MALSDEKLRLYSRRLLLSRMRLLCSHGFYGLLLMHMIFSVDEEVETACTDGERIIFGTEFLEELSDSELDFVMMHEILHVVLRHCARTGERDRFLFNVATDIVVNSNILLEAGSRESAISLAKYGVSMHLAPDGKEGHLYTAEQVYEMLLQKQEKQQRPAAGNGQKHGASSPQRGNAGTKPGSGGAGDGGWDDHSRWGTLADDGTQNDMWAKRFEDACSAIEIRDPSNSRGLLPAFAERLLKELRAAKTDWRTVLNEFVQEEVADYSFSPPDRRFSDTGFFLPDFNGTVEVVRDILFMIDTSGSMSDKMIAAAYSEIKGAIDQFDGKLAGQLGFFDAVVIPPIPFENEEEFRVIRPKGGGGTDFGVIFSYVKKEMQENPPASIVILTDGYAPFPEESEACGIPVLWLINNDSVDPPWGRVTRITV